MPQPKPYRCAVCLHGFEKRELKPGYGCPNCGTHLMMLVSWEDGYVRLNWQDLRTIAAFAVRWIESRPQGDDRDENDAAFYVENIIKQLSLFRPQGAKPLIEMRARTDMTLLDINPVAELKPDASGLVPSPFRFRRPPNNQ